jgi:hypothetical protein
VKRLFVPSPGIPCQPNGAIMSGADGRSITAVGWCSNLLVTNFHAVVCRCIYPQFTLALLSYFTFGVSCAKARSKRRKASNCPRVKLVQKISYRWIATTKSELVSFPTPHQRSLPRPLQTLAQLGRDPARSNKQTFHCQRQGPLHNNVQHFMFSTQYVQRTGINARFTKTLLSMVTRKFNQMRVLCFDSPVLFNSENYFDKNTNNTTV